MPLKSSFFSDPDDDVHDDAHSGTNDYDTHLQSETLNLMDTGDDGDDNAGLQRDLQLISSITGELDLRDYSADHFVTDNDFLNEESIYTVVKDLSGKKKVVRKSTLCWLLMKDKHSLSSDRLSRVKACSFISKPKGISVF